LSTVAAAAAAGHQLPLAAMHHPGAALTPSHHQRQLEQGLTVPVGVFMMAMSTEMGKRIF